MAKQYDPRSVEPRLRRWWEETGVYRFDPRSADPVYSIDTPPPTVSGHLHLGHVYSYSQADFMARFRRMSGDNVFYPIGYDDNGLPTERLVERHLGASAVALGRRAFIEQCLRLSEQMEQDYRDLWQRLGLSIDWRHAYRTIDDLSRRTSQWSFLDLYRKGLAYRRRAPAIWCPECRTAIAQAELADLERPSRFYTVAFHTEEGMPVPIATTRPEMLPACVAVFVHPDDPRRRGLIGKRLRVPIFGRLVPVLADPAADPEKGTGAVMCCTFGDATDVQWWQAHALPLVEALGRDGRLSEEAGALAGLTVAEARREVVRILDEAGYLLGEREVAQSVRVHERCDTAVEHIVTGQWFVRVLDFKQELIEAGERIAWHPEHMAVRYRQWVENLGWDWCISRQRYFGVPFPVWYCDECGEVVVAEEEQLPVDPSEQQPVRPCPCGGRSFTPESDVMDTWATSSLTPQIVGRMLAEPELYRRVFSMSLRPQAHEIIRTWAFYTIVKSMHHFGALPWREVAISGWGLAPEGAGKISKSRGGGPLAPGEMIERYSADACRYWAASTGFGKDAVISEEKIQAGARLAVKLWNVARFAERFLEGYDPPAAPPPLSPSDRWLLSRTQRLVARATEAMRGYDYATAKAEVEAFFWNDLADNYLEMAKQRLYDAEAPLHEGARYALHRALLTVVKLLAPFLPYVTEEVYQALFAAAEGSGSLHRARWPEAEAALVDEEAEAAGEALVAVATAVRRYKSERSLPLRTEVARLQVAPPPQLAAMLAGALADIAGVTRAASVEVVAALDSGIEVLDAGDTVGVGLAMER